MQKNGPQSFRCSKFDQNLCEELKKGLYGPDALHEVEKLVANLMCVHAKSVRDRQPNIQRSTGRSRSTGWAVMGTPDLTFVSLCKFSFVVEFLNGFELFSTYLMNRLNHFFQCNCRTRKSLNVALQISESPYVRTLRSNLVKWLIRCLFGM